MAPPTSIGVDQARMEQKKDCRSPGSDGGSGEPMDESGTRVGGRGIAWKNRGWAAATAERRADKAVSPLALSRSTGSWLPGRSLDDGAGGEADQEAVWCELSPSP